MKKYLFNLACFTLLTTGVCMGQDSATAADTLSNRRPPEGGDPTEQLIQELALTDAQAADFKAVMEQMRPPRHGEPGSSEAKRLSREEMEAQRAEAETKIKEILSEEQYTKYQELMSRRQPPRGPRPDGEGPRPMPEEE